MLQFPVEKDKLAGETVTSPVSEEEILTTTAEVGPVLRTMVKLSNDPISVTEPRELTVSPA
jgi:hypothetical protein